MFQKNVYIIIYITYDVAPHIYYCCIVMNKYNKHTQSFQQRPNPDFTLELIHCEERNVVYAFSAFVHSAVYIIYLTYKHLHKAYAKFYENVCFIK